MTFHILHRYNLERNFETANDHIDILNQNGEVWWGVFEKGILDEKTKDIQKQLSKGLETKVILTAANGSKRTYHLGIVKDLKRKDIPWYPEGEEHLIPNYYRKEKFQSWIKFSSIESADESIIDQYPHSSATFGGNLCISYLAFFISENLSLLDSQLLFINIVSFLA